jgi:hypothetical protein
VQDAARAGELPCESWCVTLNVTVEQGRRRLDRVIETRLASIKGPHRAYQETDDLCVFRKLAMLVVRH